MAEPMVTIASQMLGAAINPFGAELSSLRDRHGRELMTNADPAYWTGRAPLLFPIVGRLAGDRYRLDGQEYMLPQHGFARRLPFALVERGDDHALLRLEDSEATRPVYPFAFRLDVDFRMVEATLEISATVSNRDTRPMPFSFGFHPAFAWPLPFGAAREEHRILFESDEPSALKAISPNSLIAQEERPSPLEGRTLMLRDDLFTRDALVWEDLRSRHVSYGASPGPRLDIAFPDTPDLGLWTKPGASYICIEPWSGMADPEGFAGDIRDKPGIILLDPNASRTFRLGVTLVAEHSRRSS